MVNTRTNQLINKSTADFHDRDNSSDNNDFSNLDFDNTEVYGDYVNEDCPVCESRLQGNGLDRWCSFINCDYGTQKF